MELSTITVSEFKAFFRRDFPYLPSFDNLALYNTGDFVYYETTKLFYTALADGLTGILPTVTASWIKTSGVADNYIWDDDIEKAFVEAQAIFNPSLFGEDEQVKIAYFYLTAHYLCHDMQAAIEGLESSGQFVVSSKSAGSVSESYSIPDRLKNSPMFNFYATTKYGAKYTSLIAPLLVGNVFVALGGTRP